MGDGGQPPKLPHWSTYDSVGDWYRDYRGREPIQVAQAISEAMLARGLTFREAYRLLRDAGAIIHVNPENDAEDG